MVTQLLCSQLTNLFLLLLLLFDCGLERGVHNLVERVGRVDEHVQRELALHILRVGLTVRVTGRVVVQVGLARPEAAVVRLGVVLRTGVIVVEGEQVV